jgi:regulator of RNase E activity RraA
MTALRSIGGWIVPLAILAAGIAVFLTLGSQPPPARKETPAAAALPVRMRPAETVAAGLTIAADGVVVVPQRVEAQVLDLAFAKITGERNTLRDLQRGDKLADVFARYGIL